MFTGQMLFLMPDQQRQSTEGQFTGWMKVGRTDLLSLGVGIAAVVDESRHVSLLGGVDDLVGTQCHEVVVFVVLTGITPRSALERTVIQHLADVLHQERTSEMQIIPHR